MESAAAQSVLVAAEEHRLVPSGSVPLQKRAVSVPCLHRDALCFAGSCDDSSLSALPAAAASGRRVAEAEDLSMRRTCAPTSGEFLCWRWRWQQLQISALPRCRVACASTRSPAVQWLFAISDSIRAPCLPPTVCCHVK